MQKNVVFSGSHWMALMCSLAVCSAGAVDTSLWKGSAGNLINADGSWSAGVPKSGGMGEVRVNADYTLVVPEGGFTDHTSTTFFKAITAGATATIDATKGPWIKPAGTYANTYQSFLFSGNDGNGHIFSIENFKAAQPVMKFDGGTIVFHSKDTDTGSTVEFLSGTLNTYDPLGADVGAGVNTLFLTTARAGGNKSRVIFQPDSSLRANDVQVNGAPTDTLVLIAGGTHEIKRSLSVGTVNPSGDKDPTHPLLRMTNGTMTVDGAVVVASRGNTGYQPGSTGRIELKGDAKLVANRLELGNNAAEGIAVTGCVEVAECAQVSSSGNILIGHNPGGTGKLEIRDRAVVTGANEFFLGDSGCGELMMSGQAVLTTAAGKNAWLGANDPSAMGVMRLSGSAAVTLSGPTTFGAKGAADIEIADDATLTCGNNLWMGRNGGSVQLTVRDNGTFRHVGTTGDIYVSGQGQNTASSARIDVLGGRFESNKALSTSATNSIFNFAGGAVSVVSVKLGASANPCSLSTNVLAISGGSHEMTGTDGILLGAANTSARFEMTGGTVTVGPSGSAYVKVANEAGSKGTAVLTGGTVVAAGIVGGSGTSSALFDGVTMRINGTGTVVENLGTATLGAKGLTVEADVHAVGFRQAFVDADGVDGRIDLYGTSDAKLRPYAPSTHAKTVVHGATFVTGSLSEPTFGRNVTLTDGATLDLTGDATSFACETLTFGSDEGARGCLNVDAGDCLTMGRLNAIRGGVTHPKTGENGSYPIFRTKAATLSSHFGVINPAEGHAYAFETSDPDAEGWVTVSLAVSDATGVTHDQSVEIDGDVVLHKGITVTGTDTAVTYGGDVTLCGLFALDVATGCELTFSGTLDAAYAAVSRTGGGQLNLEADASDFEGTWSLAGGRTTFTRADAFGADSTVPNGLTLVSGTLKYAGTEPARLTRGMTIATGSNGGRVVVETAAPLTIAGRVVSTGGSLVKTGAESLALELPAGTQSLGAGNDNKGDSVVNSLPADGSSPADGQQAGLQVLEGALVLTGEGRDKTTLNQTQTTFIGTGWTGATADAALTIENLTMNQGGPVSRELWVGGGAVVRQHPSLTLRNADVSGNTLRIGKAGGTMYPEVYLTNAVMTMVYEVDIGDNSDAVHPKLTIDAEAELVQYRSGNVSTGVLIARDVDVTIRNGGRLTTRYGDHASNVGLKLAYGAYGTVRVENGGVLSTYMITDNAVGATDEKHVDFIFDDGVLELTKAGDYGFAQNVWGGFISENAGLTLDAKADVTLTSPVRGTGSVTKRGAGVLTLRAADGSDGILQQSGGVCVGEGVLDLGGTSQRIDGLRGAGTVRNGTLSGSLRTRVGADAAETVELGEGLTFGRMGIVVENAEDARIGDLLPVARVAPGVTLSDETVRGWRGLLTCEGQDCRIVGVKVEQGVVYAQVVRASGLRLIFR